MSSFESQEPQFAYSDIDWDAYSQFRPAYPLALEELIWNYHRTNSGDTASFRLAHDVGAGGGVFSRALGKMFEHVHVSDPTPLNITKARNSLGRWVRGIETKGKRSSAGTFSFSVGTAETCHESCVEGSVDLLTICEAAHFADMHQSMRSVGRALRPGGTFAGLYYGIEPRVVDNEAVDALVQTLYHDSGRAAYSRQVDLLQDDLRGLSTASIGFDFVPVPEDLFVTEKTQRITLNVGQRGESPFRLWNMEEIPSVPSEVRPGEQRLEYNYPDKEAQGWRFEVDAGWFKGFWQSITLYDSILEQFSDRFEAIEKLINETAPSKKVTVEFAATVLLATRA